jgi:hypothetical protein
MTGGRCRIAGDVAGALAVPHEEDHVGPFLLVVFPHRLGSR